MLAQEVAIGNPPAGFLREAIAREAARAAQEATTAAASQGQDDPWSMQQRLPPGTKVRLTRRDGTEIEGRVVEGRADEVVLGENAPRNGRLVTPTGVRAEQS